MDCKTKASMIARFVSARLQGNVYINDITSILLLSVGAITVPYILPHEVLLFSAHEAAERTTLKSSSAPLVIN